MYPNLPFVSPRLARRLRNGNVIDLHSYALLGQLREDLMRRAAGESSGELDEWREPTLKDGSPHASRLLELPEHRRGSCGQ